MSAPASTPDYLTDARDRLLFAQTPLVPMPRFGALEPLPIGRRRYIGAADGVYLQARHRALALTLLLAEAPLPFGTLAPEVHLPGGLIPHAIYQDIQRRAMEHAPKEWAGLVHWDERAQRYTLTEPPTRHRSTCRIRYETDVIDYERLVLNVHSHGYGTEFFSPEDDESDEFGFYFASVLGHCESTDTMTARTRIVVDSHYFDLHWHPWQDEDGNAAALQSRAPVRS